MTTGTAFLKIIGVWLGVLALLFLLPLMAQAVVALTSAEQAYLDELGEITMCVDPDWEPYERMDAQGNFTGIAADLVEIVAKRLNIPFVIIPTVDWGETLKVSKQGGCMLIPFLNQTPAREEWLTFTEPLFTNPNVFITRNEHDYISDPAELVNRTVVLPHGTSMEEHLRRDFPNLNIITVDDEHEVYGKVSAGEADMTLRSLTIAAYTIRKDGWFNLKIAGQPPQNHYMNLLRMGVLKDMPELRDILSKAIVTITPKERDQIVNEHVKALMGGSIHVQSTPGLGSTFSFTVRLEPAEDARSAIRPAQDASMGQDAVGRRTELVGRRVLLVEDNLLNRELVVDLLSDMGLQVEIAVNGLEGVLRATSESFDLILMDIQMPEMDGYEATREIRKREVRRMKDEGGMRKGEGDISVFSDLHPSSFSPHPSPRIPIIAMTAHAMAGDREKSLEAGMDDHLTKPIDPGMLKDALLRWMPADGRRMVEGGRRICFATSKGSQESSSPVPPSAFCLQPFSLPPFDIPAALKRCSNKPDLLRRLIRSFGVEFADAGSRLRALLRANQSEEAMILAHSLKGVAATLEARELSKAAKAIELALRDAETGSLDELILNLENTLAPAIEAATSLAGQDDAADFVIRPTGGWAETLDVSKGGGM